jgi:hypothetical protein
MAGTIFCNATIISYSESKQAIEILEGTDLSIEGDIIEAIGKNLDAPANAETIDATGMILSPGFINTHTHLWQTAYRSLGPDTTLSEYFFSKYIQVCTMSKLDFAKRTVQASDNTRPQESLSRTILFTRAHVLDTTKVSMVATLPTSSTPIVTGVSMR